MDTPILGNVNLAYIVAYIIAIVGVIVYKAKI